MKHNELDTFSQQLNTLILSSNDAIVFAKNKITANKVLSSDLLNQLLAVLSSTDCPQGLSINLWGNEIGDEGAKALAEALKNGKFPQDLSIDLTYNNIGDEGAKALAKALESGNCPQGLSINLECNVIGQEVAKSLAKALESGNCPRGLSINLGVNDIGVEGVKSLAKALESSNCPQGLSISLWDSKIGAEGADALAEALKSGNCPEGLSINLEDNSISSKAIDGLLKALSGNFAVHDLKISGLNDEQSELLDSYLKRNRQLSKEQYSTLEDYKDLNFHYESKNPLNHLIQSCLKHIEGRNWQNVLDLLKHPTNKELLTQSLSGELLNRISTSFSIIEQNNQHNSLETLKIIDGILEDNSLTNAITLSPKHRDEKKEQIKNLIGFLQKDEQEKEEKQFISEYSSSLKGEYRSSLFNQYMPPKLLSSLSPNLKPEQIIEILNDKGVNTYLKKNNLQVSPEIQKIVKTYYNSNKESSSIIKKN